MPAKSFLLISLLPLLGCLPESEFLEIYVYERTADGGFIYARPTIAPGATASFDVQVHGYYTGGGTQKYVITGESYLLSVNPELTTLTATLGQTVISQSQLVPLTLAAPANTPPSRQLMQVCASTQTKKVQTCSMMVVSIE